MPRGTQVVPDTPHPEVSRSLISQGWAINWDRYSLWEDIEAMDANDSYVNLALDIHASRATTFEDRPDIRGYLIESDHPKVLGVLQRLHKRLALNGFDLQHNSWQIVRHMVKHGICFLENVVAPGPDGTIAIQRVKMFPRVWEIVINVDEYGLLKQGDPNERQKGVAAYDQIDETGRLLASFYPFQITQFRFGVEQGGIYPRPILASVRRVWKRLRDIEDAMAFARLARAYTKLVHQVLVPLGATPEEISRAVKEYKDNIEGKKIGAWDSGGSNMVEGMRHDPLSVETDFYLATYYTESGDGRISVVAPEISTIEPANPQLQRLADVEYHLNRLISRLNVPRKRLQVMLSRQPFAESSITAEEEEFGYTMRAVQASFRQGLMQLFDLELILHGIDPYETEKGTDPCQRKYRIVQPEISIRSQERRANIEERLARAFSMTAGAGLPVEIAGKKYLELTPDDIERIRGEVREKVEKGLQTGVARPDNGNNGRFTELAELAANVVTDALEGRIERAERVIEDLLERAEGGYQEDGDT